MKRKHFRVIKKDNRYYVQQCSYLFPFIDFIRVWNYIDAYGEVCNIYEAASFDEARWAVEMMKDCARALSKKRRGNIEVINEI